MRRFLNVRASVIGLGLVIVSTAGCGGSPTDPSSGQPIVSVQGTWGGATAEQGTYRIVNCVDTGAIASQGFFCGQVTIGTFAQIGLTLNQSGTSVSGTAYLGIYSIPLSGTIDGSNLVLNGSAQWSVAGFSTRGLATLAGWNTTVSGTSMSGNFNLQITVPGVSGAGSLYLQIANLSRN